MASGIGGPGSFVPAGHAGAPSATGYDISGMSMAFECYLCVSSDSRCTHRYGSSSSSTDHAVLLYVQHKVRDFTGDAADFFCCGSGGQEMALRS